VMAWTGLPQLVIIPFIPLLMRRIDGRLLVWHRHGDLRRVLLHEPEHGRGLRRTAIAHAEHRARHGTSRCNGAAGVDRPAGIAPQDAGNASGIFNMMRNLGGAIGTAMLETFYTKREQYHSFIIGQHVSLLDPATRSRLADLQQYFVAHGMTDPAATMHQAVIAVGNAVQAQALSWDTATRSVCSA